MFQLHYYHGNHHHYPSSLTCLLHWQLFGSYYSDLLIWLLLIFYAHIY